MRRIPLRIAGRKCAIRSRRVIHAKGQSSVSCSLSWSRQRASAAPRARNRVASFAGRGPASAARVTRGPLPSGYCARSPRDRISNTAAYTTALQRHPAQAMTRAECHERRKNRAAYRQTPARRRKDCETSKSADLVDARDDGRRRRRTRVRGGELRRRAAFDRDDRARVRAGHVTISRSTCREAASTSVNRRSSSSCRAWAPRRWRQWPR